MSSGYSAHPDLASEQLRNAENASSITPKNQRITSPQRRRHNSAGTDAACSDRQNVVEASRGFFNFSPFRSKSIAKTSELNPYTSEVMTSTVQPKTLPDRTQSISGFGIADDEMNNVIENVENKNTIEHTKDCVDCAPSALPLACKNNDDEPDQVDQLQQRFGRSRSEQPETFYNCDQTDIYNMSKNEQQNFSEGFTSELSSAISSPSPSTISSPLSTPTRLTTQLHHSHQHCCRKSTTLSKLPGISSLSSTRSDYQHHNLHHHHSHQHLHHHHHHHHHHHNHQASSLSSSSSSSTSTSSASAVAGGCKKLQKFDPRFGPSPYRQLLPIILCILSFATVFTILIIYMDTTEIRHQQFRLNMSRDYDLYGVAQDDPTLIAFLREIHMRKYPMHFLKNHVDATMSSTVSARGTLNFSAHHDGLVPEMAHYVAELVGGKVNGAAIQSLTGAFGQLITAPWLAETLNWAGIIIEPEPRRYFTLRKQNAYRAHMQVVHACVSPNPYPKEVTIHNEESEVRINSLLDEETSWFNSRVKCFPLYTIMLACNRVEYDLLSLGVHGHELEILQTLPFEKIKIEVISIHLPDNLDKIQRGYVQTISKFLTGKGYKLQKTFGSNYFYQRINTTNRTRKKDILLLKTP